MTDAPPELGELRDEIDRIDEAIGSQIAERIDAAERVATAKSRANSALVDEDREAVVRSHYAEQFQACGLSGERGRAFADFLIELSLERERSIEGDS